MSRPTSKDRLLAFLKKEAPKCFILRWILEDLEETGEVTDKPYDYAGTSMCPVKAKRRHLVLHGYAKRAPSAMKAAK